MLLPSFKIYVLDFEFNIKPGNKPVPVCLVARELNSGETLRVWLDGAEQKIPPYEIDESSVFISYFSSAEWGCHFAQNWALPQNIIDLYAEFRVLTNGIPGISNSLLGACSHFEIETISDLHKDTMRERILQGPPYTDDEKKQILDYCESDVIATCKLFERMKQFLDFDRALFRGQYMRTIAEMEFNGVPIDREILDRILKNWDAIKLNLIEEVDKDFNLYEGTTFKVGKFSTYLDKHGIVWPKTPTGLPQLSDDTFKDMVKTYPKLQPIKDLRYILSQLKLNDLAVGTDNRNRCLLSPFRTKTGRNAPSNSKFIFGPAVWLRSLIKPEKGKVLAYIDFSRQEFNIAAVLSNDKAMLEACETGDPYLKFAKQAGAVPENATKESHKAERDLFKTCALAVQYGMRSESLAGRIGKPEVYARELITYHKKIYKKYWAWQDKIFNKTIFSKQIHTCYGWQFRVLVKEAKDERTIKNFLIQATGAEILRAACILLSEAGIKICAPVHDALLIECDEESADATIQRAQEIMQLASKYVLGKPVRTDAEVIKYPDRYSDPRGRDTWNRIVLILAKIEQQNLSGGINI